ncbi:MAG: NUDIX hydrolase [Elusimicrobiota bacterium]
MSRDRSNHFVATGYVVRDAKTLLLFHKKLRMWLPPGGHIEPGELPEDALRREIREETGLEVEILSPKRRPDPPESEVRYLHVPSHVQLERIAGHPDHVDLIYFCRAKDGRAAFSSLEHEDMRWHSLADLRKPHVREEVRRTGALAIHFAMSLDPRRKKQTQLSQRAGKSGWKAEPRSKPSKRNRRG